MCVCVGALLTLVCLCFCMLVVHACYLCALLVYMVNGKSGCCFGGCFVLLYLLRIYDVLLPYMEKKEEEKVGGGTH
jgi:hypothetical protein